MHRCRRHDARACHLAGTDYQFGRGAAKDYKRAVDLYHQACETPSPSQSIAAACTNLGYLYARGYGLKRDSAKAIHYYRRGCNADNALGCNNLGVLYEHGKHGVTRDYPRARALFDRACNAKLALGCSNLALLYRSGHGVKTDRRRAQRLFDAACRGKSSEGCRHAGWGVLRGDAAGKRDWRAAKQHFARGCSLARNQKNRLSCRTLARMRGLEGPLDITAGATCTQRGLWRPQSGRLVALSDARAKRLGSVSFASLRWHAGLMARVVIPRRAGAHPAVVLDDGRIRLRALVIPTRTGNTPRFYLAQQRQVSPVLWLAPGLRLRLRGLGSGVQATVPPSALTPLGRQKLIFPLFCDEFSLHRPTWQRPPEWPTGGPALGDRSLLRSADVPLTAKPLGRTWAHVRKPDPSGNGGLLGILATTKWGSKPRPTKTHTKRTPTLTVQLLAKRGPWQRIRHQGYRLGFVAWVRGKLLRPVATGGALAAIYGLGGLGLSGGVRRRGQPPRHWRCRREVLLSVRRPAHPGGPPRRIGVLHPRTPFTVVAAQSAMVTIRIPGLRWLKLHPKVELAIPAKSLHAVCKQD